MSRMKPISIICRLARSRNKKEIHVIATCTTTRHQTGRIALQDLLMMLFIAIIIMTKKLVIAAKKCGECWSTIMGAFAGRKCLGLSCRESGLKALRKGLSGGGGLGLPFFWFPALLWARWFCWPQQFPSLTVVLSLCRNRLFEFLRFVQNGYSLTLTTERVLSAYFVQ